MDTDPDAIIAGSIRSANEADKRAECEDDYRQVDRALDPIHELLRHDATGALASTVVSRIDEMSLGV